MILECCFQTRILLCPRPLLGEIVCYFFLILHLQLTYYTRMNVGNRYSICREEGHTFSFDLPFRPYNWRNVIELGLQVKRYRRAALVNMSSIVDIFFLLISLENCEQGVDNLQAAIGNPFAVPQCPWHKPLNLFFNVLGGREM